MINQEDMFGKFLPNIYIDRITLESSENSKLRIGVEMSIKYKMDNDTISLWFDDAKFKKYIKIKVIQSTDSDLTNALATRSLDDKTQITYRDSVVKDLTIANAIGGNDVIRAHTSVDSDGSVITNVNFRTNFELDKNNPEHLAYFTFTSIDMKELSKDYGIQVDKGMFKQNGRIAAEIVIKDYETVGTASVFYTLGGKPWAGSTHQMLGTDAWMTGPEHSKDSEPLTIEKVRNNTIQDFRHLEEIDRLSVDLSILEQSNAAQNKIRSLKNDNMTLKRKDFYFSNIYLTRDMNNDVKLMFAVDYRKIIMDTSVFKKLYENVQKDEVGKLIKSARIRSLSIKRRRVIEQKTKNKLGTTMTGEVLFNKETSPETILVSSDGAATGDFIESFNNEIGGIKEEVPSVEQVGVRYFNMFDKTVSKETNGLYQYGIEISVEERTASYLKEKLDKLILARKDLYEYYLEGTKLGMTKYIAEIQDPHIDSSSETISEITESSGNYNPISNRFTEKFIIDNATKWRSKYPDLPWSLDHYFDILSLVTSEAVSEDVKTNIGKLISPFTGNPRGVLSVLRSVDNLISKLNNLIGLDSDSRTLLTRTTTIEHWFKNNEFDATIPTNIGYDYLSERVYEGSDYLRELKSTDYLRRLDVETLKYFETFSTVRYTDPNINFTEGDISVTGDNINLLGSAYLSPKFCYFDNKISEIASDAHHQGEAMLAVRILNYNSRKTIEPPTKEFRFATTLLYSNLGLTIEPSFGRTINEDKYPNGIFDNEVIASGLYNSLMIGFMKSGSANIDSNKDPFNLAVNVAEQAGIKVWDTSHKDKDWNIFSLAKAPKAIKKEVLNYCGYDTDGDVSYVEVLKALPNQLKSLMSPIAGHPPDRDPSKSEAAASFHFKYNMINAVEYLVGFNDVMDMSRIKSPIWNPLTREEIGKIKTGKVVICRMRPFECPLFGVNQPKGLKLPVYDNYFIIRGS